MQEFFCRLESIFHLGMLSPLLFEECPVTQKGDGPSAMVVKGAILRSCFSFTLLSLSSLCNYARPNEIITPSHIATVKRGGQSDPNVSAS